MMINCKRIFKILIFVILFSSSFDFVSADLLNQKNNFFVNKSFDRTSRSNLSATLIYISNHAYFYVDDKYWDSLGTVSKEEFNQNVRALAVAFDTYIYEKETAFFGSEAKPGVDGDDRITILLEDLVENNGGYFDSSNGYKRSQISDSNQREMLVVSASAVLKTLDLSKLFLAHEFLHLISFNQKELKQEMQDDIWLSEARAEYAVTVAGLNDNLSTSGLLRRKATFLENPSDSLTEWPNNLIDYSIALIFAEYLAEKYGPEIFSQSLVESAYGIESLNRYFANKGYQDRFADAFINWAAAVYVNDTKFDARLGYSKEGLKDIRVSPNQRSFNVGSFVNDDEFLRLKNWQPGWLEFNFGNSSLSKEKSIKIDILGDGGQNFIAGFITYFTDGSHKFDRIKTISGKGTSFAVNPEDNSIKKIVVVLTNATKNTGFSTNELAFGVDVKLSAVDTQLVMSQDIKDGALIKKEGQSELYVIERGYRRYLSPQVIALYGHLDPALAITVSPEVFDSYKTSNYVKNVNDEKVYAVWADNTKHWLNMTGEYFAESGRDWGALFIINDLELNYYKTGGDITQ